MALYKASRVTDLLNGRGYVIPEDVKYVAPHVLSRRISNNGAKLVHTLCMSALPKKREKAVPEILRPTDELRNKN